MSNAESNPETFGSALPDRVIVACTATLNGIGSRRLPDRHDADGTIAAFLVESVQDARSVFQQIDAPGRVVHIDVERKQDSDLSALALECLSHSSLRPHKPNDSTVRSLDVLVTHLAGIDLSRLTIGVIGTGNIAFKAALLFSERGAAVAIHGRDSTKTDQIAQTILAVRPRHSTSAVASWGEQRVDVMVTAVAARGVVGPEWVAKLAPGAKVIDAGIGNLSHDFLKAALGVGLQVVRLDTRTAGNQLVAPAPEFFERRFGQTEVDGVRIASGGIIGARGTVVVDSYSHPQKVLGIADGSGGLARAGSLTEHELGALTVVEAHLHDRQASH